MTTKNSKGWTLIESVVVIGIILMLIGSSLISVQQIVKHENTLEVESCKNNILSFINNSKLYCRNKSNGGYILFDTINNEIKLRIGMNCINKMSLPRNFKLNDVQAHGGWNFIGIDNYGFISDACTISFLDKFNNESDITICVGSGYLEIK